MKHLFLPLFFVTFSLLFHACDLWDKVKGDDDDEFVSQYQAVYDRMPEKPPADVAQAQNTFIRSLVDSGFWARTDYLLVPATSHERNAVLNWKNALKNADNPTDTEWNELRGFKGDSAEYISLNYVPFTDAVNASTDSYTVLITILNNIQDDDYVVYCQGKNFNYTRFVPRTTSDYQAVTINSGADHMHQHEIYNSKGTHIITRTDSLAMASYNDGVLTDYGDVASTMLPSGEMLLLKDNDGYTSHEIALFMILDGVTSAEASSLTYICQTYFADIGLD